MLNPMIPKMRGVGEGYPIFASGTGDQRLRQRRSKLYFRDEISYGRVIFSGLTHWSNSSPVR